MQTNTITETTNQQRTLLIDRHFDASPEQVFAAWTEPEQLLKWWGPEGMSIGEHTLDIQEGGGFQTTMVAPSGETHTVSGKYVEIEPHSRLVLTWAWVTDGVRGHETTITIGFSAEQGGTHMHFEQRLFEDQGLRDRHNEGWSSSLNCLETHLAA